MRQKKNNMGFSLVELIVVIAIMIVLVAVLAPVFTKYVEQSRRATDVQNANTIAEAILVEVADNANYTLENSDTELTTSNKPAALGTVPDVKGKGYGTSAKFYVAYDKNTNKVTVKIGDGTNYTDNLTEESGASKYKDTKNDPSNQE